MPSSTVLRTAITVVLTMVLAASNAAALSQADRKTADLCAAATRAAESAEALPRGLLTAISLKETGRWDAARKQSVAWPWTVTAEGTGTHHASKREALDAIDQLRAAGVSNIDVGCMQINLHYHPHAFEDMQAALDPRRNAAYAGQHLRQLREDHRSWPKAVERYHSSDPDRGRSYRQAVYKLKTVAVSRNARRASYKDVKRWAERQEQLRHEYAAAKKARLVNSRKLRLAKERQRKEHRAAFEARKAKVMREWKEMLRKRREKLRGKTS